MELQSHQREVETPCTRQSWNASGVNLGHDENEAPPRDYLLAKCDARRVNEFSSERFDGTLL